jgi:hypothetical protein
MYTQPLMGSAFANKHVPTEKIGVQQLTMFPTRFQTPSTVTPSRDNITRNLLAFHVLRKHEENTLDGKTTLT